MKWIFLLFFSVFILDFLYKNLIENKNDNNNNNNNNKKKENKIFFNQDLIKNNKTKRKKIKNLIEEENNNENENVIKDDEFVYPKKQKIDNDEFEDENNFIYNLTFVYDENLYKEKLINYIKWLNGNYSQLNIFYHHLPVEKKYFILSKIVFFSSIFFTIFFVFFDKICNYIFLNQNVINLISNSKYVLSICSYFIHYFLMKRIENSYAFEIYIDNILYYSALKIGKIPNYEQIEKLLSNLKIMKKI